MAKAAKKEEVSLSSDNPEIPRPRLIKLIIKNYRCIGHKAVTIDLDDIVVLVGGNNAGKSSILRAYELVMSHGSKKGILKLEDFPNGKVDETNLPQIELHTIVYDNSPGERWMEEMANGEQVVKERWTWFNEGDPKREGWDVLSQSWVDNVPWGAPNVAKSKRPEPHRVDAFASPEEQADEIKKLLTQALDEKVRTFKADNGEESAYAKLTNQVKAIQKTLVQEANNQIVEINQSLSEEISKVFPGYVIDFDPKTEDNVENAINFFKGGSNLLMGHKDGYLSTIDRQGSGARRTLLWTALKYIAETNQKKKGDDSLARPHLLLIDEPEICLHPMAIRDACDVLYSLPTGGKRQVMITTHSPVFIDFSRNNTTIVRVERDEKGDVQGTTVFRPDKVRLGTDDKQNLKLLNICDPYVAEFLFGGRTVIVEGDTEYTAFKHLVASKPELYHNVHIIRARGKATVASVAKILNHFGNHYSILHDCDSPEIVTKKGIRRNPAWTTNQTILDVVSSRPPGTNVRLLASIRNFEEAYFGVEVEGEKPYNALSTIESDPDKLSIIEGLLNALIDHRNPVPPNCIEWTSIDQLTEAYTNKEMEAAIEGSS